MRNSMKNLDNPLSNEGEYQNDVGIPYCPMNARHRDLYYEKKFLIDLSIKRKIKDSDREEKSIEI